MMTNNAQTLQQIERAIRKVAAKYPQGAEPVLTDIHMLAKADSGELLTYDDDDRELDRCVIEAWIDCKVDNFYEYAGATISKCLHELRPVVEEMSVMRPFSFVLIDEDHETLSDLLIVDDQDTIILQGPLLEDLDKDLDAFIKRLMKE